MLPTTEGVPVLSDLASLVTEVVVGLMMMAVDGISDRGMVPPPVRATLGEMDSTTAEL